MQCNVRPNWFCYCSIYLIQWKLTFLFSVSRRLAEFIWEKSVGMGFSIVEFTEFVNQLQYIYLCLRTVLDFEYVKKCKHKKFSLIFSFISPFFLLYSVRPNFFFFCSSIHTSPAIDAVLQWTMREQCTVHIFPSIISRWRQGKYAIKRKLIFEQHGEWMKLNWTYITAQGLIVNSRKMTTGNKTRLNK